MLDTLWSQIGLLPALLVGVFAFWKGGEAERLGMGAWVLGWMAGMLLQQDGNLYQGFQFGLFVLDIAMLAVFAALTWRYRRSWPIWAGACQLVVLTSHIAFPLAKAASMTAFYTVLNVAGYGILAAIAVGTFWAWQDRRAAGLE
ncbi:hypothetical protein [Brevundimonas aurifodinae]|uniref:Uncharacterized protein n=2 Tax=Brevundimonas TaxID=41275 RepID=A0ABV1NQ16_9CAUL|nr:MAG: hypothetical protein B7Z42_08880 [Brevundimonas sp. 12-68-7]OYX32955.1 MAG: hypothetical protein B7Z01_09970 [Brevundimonas subvibrioides]